MNKVQSVWFKILHLLFKYLKKPWSGVKSVPIHTDSSRLLFLCDVRDFFREVRCDRFAAASEARRWAVGRNH